MINKLFIDTSVIIDYSRGNSEILLDLIDLFEEGKVDLFVNSVVITEFFSGQDLKNKSLYTQSFILFEKFFTCIEIGSVEGIKAGELRRKNLVSLTTDAIIASTCIINNLQLVTADVKHFNHVPGLKMFDLTKIS